MMTAVSATSTRTAMALEATNLIEPGSFRFDSETNPNTTGTNLAGTNLKVRIPRQRFVPPRVDSEAWMVSFGVCVSFYDGRVRVTREAGNHTDRTPLCRNIL